MYMIPMRGKFIPAIVSILLLSTNVVAQLLESPGNSTLTLTSAMSLPSGKAVQIDGLPFLRLSPSGEGNVIMGIGAGQNNVNGRLNTYIGHQAGLNALADSNTFVGYQAGFSTTTGKSNIFFGANAGRGNITGNRNTFVGWNAGPSLSNGDNNVYLGYSSGQHDRGSYNTFVGQGAGVLTATAEPLFNATALGANAQVSLSNSVVLGNQANVGIGTTAPKSKLEVVNDESGRSGLRLSKLTSYNEPALNTNQFLTVNEQGDVVLGTYQLRIASVSEWSDRVFEKDYSLKNLKEVEHYITKYKHLPGIPSAVNVVREGIDATYLTTKLLEKIEELTLYMIELKKADQQKNRRIKRLESELKQINSYNPD